MVAAPERARKGTRENTGQPPGTYGLGNPLTRRGGIGGRTARFDIQHRSLMLNIYISYNIYLYKVFTLRENAR